jgi:hypothetical protein
MEKGNSKPQRGKRFDFLKYAANHEINDEDFKAKYKTEMKIELPPMSTWNAFLLEIHDNPDKYESFRELAGKVVPKDTNRELARGETIKSVSEIAQESPNEASESRAQPPPEEPPATTAVPVPATTVVPTAENTITENSEPTATPTDAADSMSSSSKMVRKPGAARQGENVGLADAAGANEDENKDNTENADSEEAETKTQPPLSGANTIPDNENLTRDETSSSSASGNANSNNDGMAGIDGHQEFK